MVQLDTSKNEIFETKCRGEGLMGQKRSSVGAKYKADLSFRHVEMLIRTGSAVEFMQPAT